MTFSTKAAALFFLLTAVACLPLRAQTDYVFSQFSCIPTSCVEEGPPEKTGTASVVFGSTCTGGVTPGINFVIQTFLENCKAPYIPYASATVTSQQLENSDACPPYFYTVDYVTATSEIFTALGVASFYTDTTLGCDGSETAPITFGTKPC